MLDRASSLCLRDRLACATRRQKRLTSSMRARLESVGGENHAQGFVLVVVCSGSSVDVQRARTGADCQRGCFRAMGGEHGLLRDDDLFSDGAEAGGRKAEREF